MESPIQSRSLKPESSRAETTWLRAESYVEEAISWTPDGASNLKQATRSYGGEATVNAEHAARVERALVLLVDDNADIQNHVRDLLATQHQVITAANGEEALEALAKAKPDLILTDGMMPELDGFGFLKAVRSDPATSGIPVIVLCARAGEESRVEGFEQGADDYLGKPFTAREVLARVNAHLAIARTKRNTAEQERALRAEIERQQERLHAALAASETGTYSWDAETGKYLHFDENLKRLFGIPPEEQLIRAEQLLPRIHPDDRPAVSEKVNRSRSGADLDAEYRVVLPDGSIRWLHDRAKLQPGTASPGYFMGACTDITEKKLAQQALIQSEKLASVGRLAATVAHEINNPLEAATNLIYLARMAASLPEPIAGFLGTAEEELARVAEIARQTLGFYREQNAPVRTRLGEMLQQLLRVFAYKTRNKRISLQLEIRDDPELVAVPSELRQLVANLIGNSLDAVGRDGTVRIRLSRSKPAIGEGRVYVTVADSGPGIPELIRRRIFEPFFTTKKDVGTGLGLWVSKNIVDKHAGNIRVHSSVRPGRNGTAIRVSLPYEEAAARKTPPL